LIEAAERTFQRLHLVQKKLLTVLRHTVIIKVILRSSCHAGHECSPWRAVVLSVIDHYLYYIQYMKLTAQLKLLPFALPDLSISIRTLDGRRTIPFVCGERQRAMLAARQGESDLLFHRGNWYLLVTCDVEEHDPQDVDDVLGVDLGVTNIATDSNGTIYSGSTVKGVRYRHRRLRNKLQKKGTLSAKRRLRKLSGQEARFAKDVNHTISKRIIREAQRTKRGIALEDLKNIRTRVRARKSQRTVLHSWSFFQLQACIVYKATLAGIPVVLVDPRNTSRTCPDCGHIAKANRKTQASFKCVQCGCAGHADTIAAGNIRVLGRAAVMQPHVSEAAELPCQRQAARF
jgi:putative transposase